MGFSGKVNNPGLWELPFGITARELFEEYAGGMKPGYRLKTWQPGGVSRLPAARAPDAQMYAGGIGRAPAWVRVLPWRWMTASTWSCCATWRSSCPRILRLVHPAATACPGASRSCGRWSGARANPRISHLEQLVSFLGPGKTFCAHAPGAVEPLAVR
jgi:NADH-quinone oxidoreductase subunit F